ncbi:MAG: transposase, partial [Colwellia sp.]|nr:transposase [Colwellia sp.]
MKNKSTRGRKKKPPIPESAIGGFKYFKSLLPLLQKLRPLYAHHNRDLHYDQYILLLLLYFFNPIITSLRGIQQVSELKKVQEVLGVGRCSLGSLSEASNVFDSELIGPFIQMLAEKALETEIDPKLKAIEKQIVAVDGSLLPALPKILWALWVDDQHRAAKLHLEFDIKKSIPVRAAITEGNGNEKENLRQYLSSDKLYVLDGGYGQYKLFDDIHQAGSNFVVRLKDNAVWDIIEEKALTEADCKAGIKRDMTVRLGSAKCKDDLTEPVRIIEVFHKGSSNRPNKSKASFKKTS